MDAYDLIVVGSGAGGLTAALTASLLGLRALVLEHAPVIGGTSARSSGTVWVPDNHHMRDAGIHDDAAESERYLSALVGNRGDTRLWRAFIETAPAMLRDLEVRGGLRFKPFMSAPDYRQDVSGAARGGRPLEPQAFDGRLLGDDFSRLASPLPELMLFGGMMVTRGEGAALLRADRSPRSAWLGLRLVARYLVDRLKHRRGTRLVLGNALVARLMMALKDRGVSIWTDVRPRRLVEEGGRIVAIDVERGGHAVRLNTRRGVVLAGGGFPASPVMRAQHLPKPTPEHTPAAPGCDGSSIALGMAAGGALGPDGLDNAQWFPSSLYRRKDGSTAVYPHIVLDRAKPGLIAVDSAGRRFVNEAVSYHEFCRGMYGAHGETPCIPAWLVCDRGFIRRYGLGVIRPRTPSLRRYVAEGYLLEGASLSALAQKIGVPADTLGATVERFNGFARTGVDADFRRGETIYERGNGDPAHGPNPCLGPIAKPPFYAVAVYPTPLGTSRGLMADPKARVLRASGDVIPGLYVCGNDMQSAFGGEYPGAGGQLGQAMTFGWIAAQHTTETTRDRASA
ncbi:FAD-dependent oxidoreductase [Breoghania sp. L-A4]|nr:FAD-dependent oxidoreductase [Breoghania sp. L-A4]